ncbi:MAG: Uma2 family endonuclease [Chloroflexota bacterium]
MVLSHPRLTLDAFLALPEQEPPLEFVEGVVTQKMAPGAPHSVGQGTLLGRLFTYGERTGAVFAFPEQRLILDDATLVPDIAVYRADRVPYDEHGDIQEYFTAPPDLVVEVASPGQSLRALRSRCRWFVQHGVQASLLVVPRDRTIQQFRPGWDGTPIRGSERVDLDDLLPGFVLTPEDVFARLRRPVPGSR